MIRPILACQICFLLNPSIVDSFVFHSSRNHITTSQSTRTTEAVKNLVPSLSLSATSRKNMSDISLQSKKKHSKRILIDNHRGIGRRNRASKQDIHDLVKNMGLQPVLSSIQSLNADADANVNVNQQTNLTQQPPKEIEVGKKNKEDRRDDVVDISRRQQLSLKTQLEYARKGHTILPNLLDPIALSCIKQDLIQFSSQRELDAWQQKVEVALKISKSTVQQKYPSLKACQDALMEDSASSGTAKIPFLQHFNTWQKLPSVKQLVCGEALVKSAKELMNVQSVKLYQDSLFHKRAEDGPTPWHSDARMAPFDTSNMITFWIPLDYIPASDEGGTGLMFVNSSHSDFALPFWNQQDLEGVQGGGEYERLDMRYGGDNGIEDHMPMDVGDVSVHSGWTLHSAAGGVGPIGNGADRYALAVTYVDDMAEVREDVIGSDVGHDEDRRSYEGWVKDVEPRCHFEHPLVPTL